MVDMGRKLCDREEGRIWGIKSLSWAGVGSRAGEGGYRK